MKLTANVLILNFKFFFSAIISEVEYKWTFNFFESWRFWQFFLNHSFCVITVTLLTSVLLEIILQPKIPYYPVNQKLLSKFPKLNFLFVLFSPKKKSSYSTFLPKISILLQIAITKIFCFVLRSLKQKKTVIESSTKNIFPKSAPKKNVWLV